MIDMIIFLRYTEHTYIHYQCFCPQNFKKGKLTNLLISCLGSLGKLTAIEVKAEAKYPDSPPVHKWHLHRVTVADCEEAQKLVKSALQSYD